MPRRSKRKQKQLRRMLAKATAAAVKIKVPKRWPQPGETVSALGEAAPVVGHGGGGGSGSGALPDGGSSGSGALPEALPAAPPSTATAGAQAADGQQQDGSATEAQAQYVPGHLCRIYQQFKMAFMSTMPAGLTSLQKMKAANAAWKSSEIRAQLIASVPPHERKRRRF